MAVIVNVDNNHLNGTVPSDRQIDLDYFRTPPGMLKIAQFILGVVLLCLSTPVLLTIVVYLAFFFTTAWMWIYFFALQSKYQSRIPWPVMEFYYTAAATVAYGIASLVSFLFISFIPPIFGLLNTLAYAVGAFFLMKDWKEWKSQNAGMQGP